MPVSTVDITRPMQSTNSGEPGSNPASSTQHGRGGDHTATGAGVDTGAGTTREKTEAELEADRLYEERMEEEYAKREGGA